MTTLEELTEEIVTFRDERDSEQFHRPRHLAAAISIEAGELQETLLWLAPEEVAEKLSDDKGREQLADEFADVMIYSLLFAHSTQIDPTIAVRRKLEKNSDKYPVNASRGSPKNYTDLPPPENSSPDDS